MVICWTVFETGLAGCSSTVCMLWQLSAILLQVVEKNFVCVSVMFLFLFLLFCFSLYHLSLSCTCTYTLFSSSGFAHNVSDISLFFCKTTAVLGHPISSTDRLCNPCKEGVCPSQWPRVWSHPVALCCPNLCLSCQILVGVSGILDICHCWNGKDRCTWWHITRLFWDGGDRSTRCYISGMFRHGSRSWCCITGSRWCLQLGEELQAWERNISKVHLKRCCNFQGSFRLYI